MTDFMKVTDAEKQLNIEKAHINKGIGWLLQNANIRIHSPCQNFSFVLLREKVLRLFFNIENP